MRPSNEGSTDPTLLQEVADWQNHPAWVGFQARYGSLLRRWCCEYGLDDESADEVCQLIWIELAHRMRTFSYDPNGTFRGWLRKMCEWRVRDYLRQVRGVGEASLDVALCGGLAVTGDADDPEPTDEALNRSRPVLLEEAERVQATVKAKVQARSWEAFWLVAVQGWPVERTANHLGMTHTAVYAARARVARMLRKEGKSASDRRRSGD